ncbi:helix-turn-helix transcriptional regulator [Catellatospora sp. IY07-71]|uniref:helix-turn-helix transcriptional regulator n=1 Tax=Catellatospora sp. IY07-71 TaxID=2728827 RepID=UPI0035304AFA
MAVRDPLMELEEVLAELGVAKSTFYAWKATGRAPKTIKYPNGSLRVRRSALDKWLSEHEENA